MNKPISRKFQTIDFNEEEDLFDTSSIFISPDEIELELCKHKIHKFIDPSKQVQIYTKKPKNKNKLF